MFDSNAFVLIFSEIELFLIFHYIPDIAWLDSHVFGWIAMHVFGWIAMCLAGKPCFFYRFQISLCKEGWQACLKTYGKPLCVPAIHFFV